MIETPKSLISLTQLVGVMSRFALWLAMLRPGVIFARTIQMAERPF